MGDLTISAAREAKAVLFLQAIRISTGELHVLLESNKLLSSIIQPGVTASDYYCYLLLMNKVTEVYEQNILTRLPMPFQEYEGRRASQLITEDMQTIGYTLPPGITIKDFTVEAVKLSIPFALGFMYVMEGSRLGGKVIFKNIQRYLGFSANHGAKFVADPGANTLIRWKAFLSSFSGYVADNDCEGETIQGAKYAFSSIYGFFESNRLIYEN